MAYYQCIDCRYYDESDTNRYDEGWCTEYCKYYPKGDKACGRFERRSDYSSSGCFLTTAICDIFGCEDNCFCLETLRKFRDNYLVKNSKFYPLLAEYEVVGPKISDKLHSDYKREEVASYYYENYLYDIMVDLTVTRDYDSATVRYVSMVNDLKRLYGIDDTVKESDVVSISDKIKNNQYKVKKKTK